MSVRDLAPSLQALGELFDRASFLLYSNGAVTDLKVTATPPGSFEVVLSIEMVRIAATMLASPLLTSALNVREMIVIALSVLKHIKGDRAILRSQSNEQTIQEMAKANLRLGNLELSMQASDETTRQVLLAALTLVKDQQIRGAFRRVAEPVGRDGVERLSVKEDRNELESIGKQDLPSFGPLPEENDVVDAIIPRQWLKVVSPHLGEQNGRWKFHDGNRVNWYSIRDQSFENEVKKGARGFRYGDILECQVRQIQQVFSGGRIKTDFEILRVFAHRSVSDEGTQSQF